MESDDRGLWAVQEVLDARHVQCGAGKAAQQYLVRWQGCDPDTDEEWGSSWLGSTALTKDLLSEAREIERGKSGWVVGEEHRKRGRAEPLRARGRRSGRPKHKGEGRGGRGRGCGLVGEGEAQDTVSRGLAGG